MRKWAIQASIPANYMNQNLYDVERRIKEKTAYMKSQMCGESYLATHALNVKENHIGVKLYWSAIAVFTNDHNYLIQ